jgi:predicted unusual protein kinase regulating ubiquinone biosynthesis (AarF/ABC1/UbiB family)
MRRYQMTRRRNDDAGTLNKYNLLDPTFVKVVQWALNRHDLFSPEFLSHLLKLQDKIHGHAWLETEMTLVRVFGKD